MTLRTVPAFGIGRDAIIAPTVVGVGLAVDPMTRRFSHQRGLVRSTLAILTMLSALSFPAIRGYGNRPGNPSALPFRYGTRLGIWVAFVLLVAIAIGVVREVPRRRHAD